MKDDKHLTNKQRMMIQSGLINGKSFKAIGREIGKDCTSVSREVRRHITVEKKACIGKRFNDCVHSSNCPVSFACDRPTCSRKKCYNCAYICNSKDCKSYEKKECSLLKKPPYVCSNCSKRNLCTLEKHYYDAALAQKEYRQLLCEARQGFCIDRDEQESIGAALRDYLSRGFSVNAAIAAIGEDHIGYSAKTIYNYIDAGVFEGIGNYLLPRKIRYRPRKRNAARMVKVNKQCTEGRTYADFKAYMEENPDVCIVQMDSVEGKKGVGEKVLLTIHFTNCHLMLMYLRDANTAKSVEEKFQWLREKLGREAFKKLFPLILTDNGSEFSNPDAIELDPETGELLTMVFYCEPRQSQQKGACENNHQFIRRIVNQGESWNGINQGQVDLMRDNINSYPRESLGGKTPYDAFLFMYGEETAKKLGLTRVETQNVIIKPSLF